MEFRRLLFRSRGRFSYSRSSCLPFVLSLSKHRSSLPSLFGSKQGQPFDKLRANGFENQPLVKSSRAAATIVSRLGSVSVAALPSGMKLSSAARRASVFRSEEHTSELQSLMRISY